MNIPTSSESLTYFDRNCEICLKTGHGLHFGIETCRACAAFFRRTVVLNRKYKCNKRNGKCEIGSSDEKLMCKFCRFKKCIDLGMTTENVRTDETVKSDSMELTPATSSNADRVEYSILHPKTQTPAMLIDVNAIIRRSKTILETYFLPDEDSITHLNPLQRMVHSLQKIRSKQNWNPEFFVNIKFYDIFGMWEVQMRHAAEWLMYCDQFRQLPIHERDYCTYRNPTHFQVAIFKIVWAVWRRFERYTMSAEIFGQKCYDEKILLHSHECAVRIGNYFIDYSNISDHGFERFNNLFGGKMLQYYDIIVKPYLELKMSQTEITFILCQIVWNYAGRRLQGQTLSAGDTFLATISENLHEYYEQLPDGQNYAGRLTRMMQVVNGMLNIQLKREDTMEVAMLFDLFNIVLTEPEFFRV